MQATSTRASDGARRVCDAKVTFANSSQQMVFVRQQGPGANHQSRVVGEALAASRGRVQDPPLRPAGDKNRQICRLLCRLALLAQRKRT